MNTLETFASQLNTAVQAGAKAWQDGDVTRLGWVEKILQRADTCHSEWVNRAALLGSELGAMAVPQPRLTGSSTKPLRPTLTELARARADTSGSFNSPPAAGYARY